MSYWLYPGAETETELASLLDRVETRLANLREFILPPNWAQEKARLTALGLKPPRYRGQRGPVTFAMSLFGVEKLIFLIMDNPPLAARYRDVILRALLERARILDEEAGDTPATAPHGWGWADDNCAMLNAEMYEFFGWPILKAVFERYSPTPNDSRYQHSDSDMGHLLPLLGRLNLTGVNFGPNVMPADIRRHLPQAAIHGQLAPFTFSRNEEVNMVAEFLRDFGMVRDTKGLVFATAGSINNGSLLSGMRLLMAAIQEYGRY
jgi:uroporphyrinogen decarboxylase